MKASIKAGSLTPGLLSTPEETSIPGGWVAVTAVATLSQLSPPESIQGLLKAGPRGVPGRLGVEENAVGDGLIGGKAREIRLRAHAKRLHHGQAIAGADLGDPRGRLAAMQLQDVGRQRCDHLIQIGVVRIHA
jgi:hypothetical protein